MNNKIPLLFVTVDALGRRMLENAETPFIDSLMEKGANVEKSHSCFPTLTTPMMSTILTGCYPDNHGINCNSRFSASEKKVTGKLRDLKRNSIAEVLRKNGYRTLSVQHFMLEGRVDEYHQVDGAKSEVICDTISTSLSNKKYDAVFCIYQAVDHYGHKHGPVSRKTLEEIKKVDVELEKLVTRMKREWGEFVLALTSDHSMSLAHVHSDFSLLESLKKMGLNGRYCETGDVVKDDVDCVILKYPTVAVFLNSAKAVDMEDKIIDMLKNEKDMEKVYNKDDMKKLGNGDYADIAYFLKAGYTDFPAPLLKLKKFGYHGTENEMDSTICYWGSGIGSENITDSNLTDVVPTCLDFLNIEFDENDFDGSSKRR